MIEPNPVPPVVAMIDVHVRLSVTAPDGIAPEQLAVISSGASVVAAPVPIVIPVPGNPLTAMPGVGYTESLVVGNDYDMSPRGTYVALEGHRLWLWGPHWAEEGGTVRDNTMWADLVPRGASQNLRAAIYADGGGANKYDLGRAAISRPSPTAVAVGDEVTIAANAAPGRYGMPIAYTYPADGFYWIGPWAGYAAPGQEVQVAITAGGFGRHRFRSNTGAMNYASTGLPPPFTSSNATLSERSEASIHFEIQPVATAAPTLRAIPNADSSIQLIITRKDTRTREYRLERSDDAGASWTSFGVIACTGIEDTFRDPDLNATSYQYRVSALYRSASAGSVVASATASGARKEYATSHPVALPITTTVSNPGRGVADFDDSGQHIPGVKAYELYARSWAWNALQPIDSSNFNFPYGDNAIAKAVARGQRVWLRWRGYNTMGAGTLAPAWLVAAGLTNNGVPLWNNSAVVEHMINVYKALGARYNGNSAVYAWDVGGFGRYGEWADGGDGGDISVANAMRIIAAACNAFSNSLVMLSLPDHTLDQAVYDSLLLFPNLHVRQDGIGGNFAPTALWEATFQAKVTGGKRSPRTRGLLRGSGRPNGMDRCVGKHAESFSTSSTAGFVDPVSQILTRKDIYALHVGSLADTNYNGFASWSAAGRQAIQDAVREAGYRYRAVKTSCPVSFVNGQPASMLSWWLNEGSAPCYEPWRPQYQLRDDDGVIRGVSALSSLFLRDVPQSDGSPRMHEDIVTFTGVAPGPYKLCLQVPQLNQYTPHMRLSHSLEKDSVYTELGNVVVV